MIQRAAARSEVLQEIVARITSVVSPWRIVLFGSRARGNPKEHSDYDIYVEVDAADDEALKKIHGQIWSLISGRGWTFDLKTRRRGTIERRRDDPGTIEWDVAREGKILYADPAASTELAPPRVVREPSPEPPVSVYEWLESAERNLRMREDLKATGKEYSPEICWLSHQICEKYMKALLVSLGVRPKRTHDLSDLLGALRANGLALPGLDADCKLLTKHAIDPRYPAGLDLGEQDARAASTAAERVIATVRALLPPRLH
jgi:HEPN domain-containing protein/predicted nucleotidyltransferase